MLSHSSASSLQFSLVMLPSRNINPLPGPWGSLCRNKSTALCVLELMSPLAIFSSHLPKDLQENGWMCKLNCKLHPIDSDSYVFPWNMPPGWSSLWVYPVSSYSKWLYGMLEPPRHPQTLSIKAAVSQLQSWCTAMVFFWVQFFLPVLHPNRLVNTLVGLKSSTVTILNKHAEKWKKMPSWWKASPCCFTQFSIYIEPWRPFLAVTSQFLSLLTLGFVTWCLSTPIQKRSTEGKHI